MPTPGADASGWEDALLAKLKCPVVFTSSLSLSLWAKSEGMPGWANNWLATEKGGYGGRLFNAAGVYAYPSFDAGIAATAATISQRNMRPILTALRKKATAAQIFDAINASPWCKGCQGGIYPEDLYYYVVTVAPPPPAPPGAKPPPGGGTPMPVQGPTQPTEFDWSNSVRQSAAAIDTQAGRIHGYASNLTKL